MPAKVNRHFNPQVRQTLAVVLVLFVSGMLVTEVDASAEPVQDLIICKSPGRVVEAGRTAASVGASVGKAVRMLRVYKTQEVSAEGTATDGCRATYSKSNVEQTVGSSRYRQQCRNIIVGIQKNLEASHWTCRSVASVNSLSSAAAAAGSGSSLQ